VNVTIRKYRSRDKAAVLDITERSFDGFCLDQDIDRHFGLINGRPWQERKKNGIEYDLCYQPSDTFVAEVDGKTVGFVCTRLYQDQWIGHVANMAVAPEFQGRGIGKALMQAALDHFKEHRMRYARIETLEQNYKGRKFYPAVGFKEVARQIYYFMEL